MCLSVTESNRLKFHCQGPLAASPVDSSLFSGNFNFEFLPFAITSDVGPQFIKVASINSTEV